MHHGRADKKRGGNRWHEWLLGKSDCTALSPVTLFSWKYMQAYHCCPYQHPQQPSASVTYAPCDIWQVQFFSDSPYNSLFNSSSVMVLVIKVAVEANVLRWPVHVTFFSHRIKSGLLILLKVKHAAAALVLIRVLEAFKTKSSCIWKASLCVMSGGILLAQFIHDWEH